MLQTTSFSYMELIRALPVGGSPAMSALCYSAAVEDHTGRAIITATYTRGIRAAPYFFIAFPRCPSFNSSKISSYDTIAINNALSVCQVFSTKFRFVILVDRTRSIITTLGSKLPAPSSDVHTVPLNLCWPSIDTRHRSAVVTFAMHRLSTRR